MNLSKGLLSIKDLDKEQILYLLRKAESIKKNGFEPALKGKILASCFFEPSTRTRLSFESAMKRLGGEVIGFSEAAATSMEKGESLFDSIKIIGYYADAIVIRHPLEGSARCAAEATDKPVINAGDGSNEHPTQTLLDLFSILECQKGLENLHVAFAGDLLNGRTIHSLALALRYFNPRLYFVSPSSLSMSDSICQELRKFGVPFSFHKKIEEVLDKADILYMSRIQKERFTEQSAYEMVKDCYRLSRPTVLKFAKPNLKILHPLPRLNEIEMSVDTLEHAYYFNQAENGLYMRAALLMELFGK